MGFIISKTKGYTFVELMVAMAIFASVLVIVTSITINFNNSQKRERARNMLIEETQFFMTRLAEMIRENQIDYSEYYSNGAGRELVLEYGNEPQEYEWHFWFLSSCETGKKDGEYNDFDGGTCERAKEGDNFDEGIFDTFADKESINDNEDEHALLEPDDAVGTGGYMQRELYLISKDGKTKTVLKRMSNGMDDDGDGTIDEDGYTFWKDGADDRRDGGERLGMLQMVTETGDDGKLKFVSAPDFQVDGNKDISVNDLISITPKTLDIVDLKFYISPLDDPRKAWDEDSVDVQVQPHVTILLTTRPGIAWRRNLVIGDKVSLSVQTTVSSRVITDVLFPDS